MARRQLILETRPQLYLFGLVIISVDVAILLGARTWTLIPPGVSALLGVVIWQCGSWLLHAWRSPDFRARARVGPGGEDAQHLVRTVLRLAVAVSLLWLVWVIPRPWQYLLAIAVTTALAIRAPRWLAHRAAALARYLPRTLPVLRRAERLCGRLPASGWATIGLLAVANTLIALALLDTARFPFGSWAIHTKIAFVLMCAADVAALKAGVSASLRAGRTLSQDNYVLTGESGTRQARPQRFHRFRRWRLNRKVRTAAVAGAAALIVGWVSYAHPGPWLVVATLVVGASALAMTNVSRHQAITMLLAIALGVAAIDYVAWRVAVTNWQGWWIAVPLLFAEALGAIHTLGFQLTVWPWPTPAIEASEDPAQYEIFMLIATVNEGVSVLRPTIEGCLAARQKYLAENPDGQVTIVVCNDGLVANYPDWMEVELLAQELGVCCVTRSIPGGAKAGNIEHARRQFQITGNRLLGMFDADQVPEPDFLLKTIPPFADPKMGWVQTGQYYANLDNPVSRWADDQQSMFYNVLCPGKAALNAAFICGTNVVLRGAALEEIGGLPQDSVTEDFAASIKLHARWRSIYLTDVLATGLGPLDIPSYLKQQGRWALGTLTAFRGHWADILLPKQNGLRFGQRIQYFLAGTHYLCGLRDLIYLISPALFIFTGVPAVRSATLSAYMLHFLPYGALGLVGMWYTSRGVTGLRGVIIGFGSTPALLASLVATVMFRKKSFALTSKARSGRRSLRYLGIYIAPLLLCFAALAWTTQVQGRQATSMFISLLWVVYSVALLLSFLWLAYQDIRAQRAGDERMLAKQAYPTKLRIRENALRPLLNLGIAALVASPLLFGTRLANLSIFDSPAAPFVITQQQVDARYPGVSLPIEELSSAPPMLARAVGISFSIVGRTQVISDQFDTSWADKLAAQGARPWVTLQFGSFGSDQRSPLTAQLPAIYNGVDDSAIRRWATEIRDYGKPVYLTVLLQVDKNWAVSSGVANGGIPEDVPKAWEHIQGIFRAVGANNVAWVWAPADALHDQQFAPPPSTIDVVLQDFIGYPGTRWGDPVKVLRGLTARYPGKPLIVEVALAGAPAEKVSWLGKLRRALNECTQVHAVVYHEGGPVLKPTRAQAKLWSEASDPASLAAWKRIVTGGARGDLRRAADRGDIGPGPRLAARGGTLADHRGADAAGSGFADHAAQLGIPGRGAVPVRGSADHPSLGRRTGSTAGLLVLPIRVPVCVPGNRRVP